MAELGDVNAKEPAVELYGTNTCPYTRELREHLEWTRVAFTEYDVEIDAAARARMLALTEGHRTVPVLVREGRVAEIGWRGRGCMIDSNERPT